MSRQYDPTLRFQTLFTNTTQETISILQDNSYHLILDEAVDVLLPLNDLIDSANYRVNKRNVQLMLDNNIIAVDEDCRVRWTGGPQPIDGEERHSFCEVQRHAQNGNLLLIDGKFSFGSSRLRYLTPWSPLQ